MRALRWLFSESNGLMWVLAGATLLRLAPFVVAVSSPQRFFELDDREYLPIAMHLHAAYLTDSGRLFDLGLRRTPAYPLFIRGIYAVFGRHYAPVIAAQLVLSVAAVALTFWLASLLLPRRYALAAAALLAIDPASIVFANQLLTETLFTFLLLAGLTLAVIALRRGWTMAVFAGLLLGSAVLVRPVIEYLPVVLVPTMLLIALTRARIAAIAAIALLIGFAIPTGAWAIRNYEKTGVPIISTIDGHNMLQYNAVGALVHSGVPRQLAQHNVLVALAPHVHPGENAAKVSRAELSVGFKIVREHPAGAFKDWLRGEVKMLLGPSRSETATLLTGQENANRTWLRGLIAVEEIITLVLVVGAVAGMGALLIGRIRTSELWILAAAASYLVIISGGHEAYSRFRVPVDPIFAILAAAAVSTYRKHRPAPALPSADEVEGRPLADHDKRECCACPDNRGVG